MALFQVYRGVESDLPEKKTDGYIYFCIDSRNIYIDHLNETGEVIRSSVNENRDRIFDDDIADIYEPLILKNNTEYRLTDVSSLTLVYPDEYFETWMRISFSLTGAIELIFPVGTKFIGAEPSFNGGETWEISIKDGVVICWRIE